MIDFNRYCDTLLKREDVTSVEYSGKDNQLTVTVSSKYTTGSIPDQYEGTPIKIVKR
jgi:hypothetical protein